ncbi:MAG: MFS transporter [Anaerolineae bacterium]
MNLPTPTTTDENPKPKTPLLPPVAIWRLIAIAAFAFALTLNSNTLNPTIYTHKMRLFVPSDPNAASGLVRFAGLIIAAITQPLVGILSDRTRSRWGRRLPYFAVGTVSAVIFLYGLAASQELITFVAFAMLAQVALNIVQGPWQALIPDQVPETQRGRASGIRAMLDIMAVVVGGLVVPRVVAQYESLGISAILLAISIPVAALITALGVTAYTIRDTHHAAVSVPKPPSSPNKVSFLARAFDVDFKQYPAFRWWLINRFLFWTGTVGLSNFLINYAIDVLGMTVRGANEYYSEVAVWLGLSLLVAALPSGWLSDRIGRKPLIIAAGLIAAFGTLPFVLFTWRPILLAGGSVVGFATGVFLSANWALATEIVPRQEAARYLGIANIATAMGIGAGALFGVVIDTINRTAGNHVTGYQTVYAIMAIIFVLSSFVIWRMRVPKRAPIEDNNPESTENLSIS